MELSTGLNYWNARRAGCHLSPTSRRDRARGGFALKSRALRSSGTFNKLFRIDTEPEPDLRSENTDLHPRRQKPVAGDTGTGAPGLIRGCGKTPCYEQSSKEGLRRG